MRCTGGPRLMYSSGRRALRVIVRLRIVPNRWRDWLNSSDVPVLFLRAASQSRQNSGAIGSILDSTSHRSPEIRENRAKTVARLAQFLGTWHGSSSLLAVVAATTHSGSCQARAAREAMSRHWLGLGHTALNGGTIRVVFICRGYAADNESLVPPPLLQSSVTRAESPYHA